MDNVVQYIDVGQTRGYPNTIVNSGDVLGQITLLTLQTLEQQISKDRVLA